jgi:hypothetical protein
MQREADCLAAVERRRLALLRGLGPAGVSIAHQGNSFCPAWACTEQQIVRNHSCRLQISYDPPPVRAPRAGPAGSYSGGGGLALRIGLTGGPPRR